MNILKNIQEQPRHIREIMFSLCVIITVSLVGIVWFNDFQSDMYALLNPEEVQQERFLAENKTDSLFGFVGQTLGDIGSIWTDFWGSVSSGGGMIEFDSALEKSEIQNSPGDKVYLLPLSEQK